MSESVSKSVSDGIRRQGMQFSACTSVNLCMFLLFLLAWPLFSDGADQAVLWQLSGLVQYCVFNACCVLKLR